MEVRPPAKADSILPFSQLTRPPDRPRVAGADHAGEPAAGHLAKPCAHQLDRYHQRKGRESRPKSRVAKGSPRDGTCGDARRIVIGGSCNQSGTEFIQELLGHEYTHSWDGKFRRSADLWTPNFNVPMRDDLLWVYEGMTQYFGNVLTARAGMRTPQETRDVFARVAAGFEMSPGRDGSVRWSKKVADSL